MSNFFTAIDSVRQCKASDLLAFKISPYYRLANIKYAAVQLLVRDENFWICIFEKTAPLVCSSYFWMTFWHSISHYKSYISSKFPLYSFEVMSIRSQNPITFQSDIYNCTSQWLHSPLCLSVHPLNVSGYYPNLIASVWLQSASIFLAFPQI